MNTSITPVSDIAIQEFITAVNSATELAYTLIEYRLPKYKEMGIAVHLYSRFTNYNPNAEVKELLEQNVLAGLSELASPDKKLHSPHICINLDILLSRVVLNSYAGRLHRAGLERTYTNLFIILVIDYIGLLQQRLQISGAGLTEAFDAFMREVLSAGAINKTANPEALLKFIYGYLHTESMVNYVEEKNKELLTCLDF